MKNLEIKAFTLLALLGTSTLFADGASLYKRCVGCHGVNGEKKALGKGEIITAWDESKTLAALKGYKDGSYGKAMKGVMKGQVIKLSDEELEVLAKHISTLK